MRTQAWRWCAAPALVALVVVTAAGQGTTVTGKVVPKLEPVAETKLVMEGMAYSNFRGLEKLLTQKPAEPQAWTFARGQALLIAESANLLLIRPPRTKGQDVWFQRATELRTDATNLAKLLAARDYDKSRVGFVQLANTCNRCHQSFRVPVEITPFVQDPPPATKT